METIPVKHGRLFNIYTAGSQRHTSHDRLEESNHNTSHSGRWEGSKHFTPIQLSKETDQGILYLMANKTVSLVMTYP